MNSGIFFSLSKTFVKIGVASVPMEMYFLFLIKLKNQNNHLYIHTAGFSHSIFIFEELLSFLLFHLHFLYLKVFKIDVQFPNTDTTLILERILCF